jgi:manganese oxidase
MPAGGDMNTGMGMLQGAPGVPLGDAYGPAVGRGLGGVGNSSDMNSTNGPLFEQQAKAAMPGMRNGMEGMQTGETQVDVTPNANNVPNFPQDAYMEGPMMMMDAAVDRPENYGLKPGWSGYMQGMMTFVRVLEPDKYDDVISRMRQAKRTNDPYAAILERA